MTTTRATPPRMTPRSAAVAAMPKLPAPAGANSDAAKDQPTPKPRARRRTIRPASPKSIDEVLAGIGTRDANSQAALKVDPRRDITNGRRARIPSTPKESPPAGPDSRAANRLTAPKSQPRRGITSHPTKHLPISNDGASGGFTIDVAKGGSTPKQSPRRRSSSGAAIVDPTPNDAARRRPTTTRPSNEPAMSKVDPTGGSETSPQARRGRQRNRDIQSQAAAGRHAPSDTQEHGAASVGPAARMFSIPTDRTLLDPTLALAADVLDDIERVRIANENRLRQLTRSVDDVDGELRGFGLTEEHPAVARLAAIVATLVQVEKDATKALEKTIQDHPLHPWIKAQRGVGDKQAARLLAAIGDPYIRPELHYKDGTVKPEGPRTVSALWAYSGYHTVPVPVGQASSVTQTAPADGAKPSADQAIRSTQAPSVGGTNNHPTNTVAAQMAFVWLAAKRARGQKANWSATAKMRAHLVAEKVVQLGFRPKDADDDWKAPHYRAVYDNRRAVTADRVHAVACVRCGPSGKPAPAGSPWSKGHQHADGLRIVSKEILKDLWREGKRLHEPADGDQTSFDAQSENVAVRPDFPAGQVRTDAHMESVGGDSIGGDQGARDTHSVTVAARPNHSTNFPAGHRSVDAQSGRVGGDLSGDHTPRDAQSVAVTANPNVLINKSVTEDQSRFADGDGLAPDQEVHDAHAGLVGGSP